jgi:apolipoprotein N-acyltransferase
LSRGRSRARAATLFVVAVALGWAAHSQPGAWPLALVVLAPLAAFAETAPPVLAFAFAWASTVVTALLVTTPWLRHALVLHYEVPGVPAVVFGLAVIASCAVPSTLPVALYARLRPRAHAGTAALLFAALVVAGEWLRAEPLRCPWLLSGHPLTALPILVQTAELGGAHLVGFVAVAVSGGLGIALARRCVAALVAPGVLLALCLGWGALRLADPAIAGVRESALRVGVVQAAVPQDERFEPSSARAHVAEHAELTRALVAQQQLDLVVWSETAVDGDIDATPGLTEALVAAADDTGVPIVTGVVRSSGGQRTNSVVVVLPGAGIVGSHAKQRLLPFAESDPAWGGLLAPLVAPLVEGEPFAAGVEPTVLHAAGLGFATPVCFEILYPDLMRRFRAAGAALLVNLSNDAWFGRTSYAHMQLPHLSLRAIELRSWVVRGANTGISAVVDPWGRVVAQLGAFEQGTITAQVRAAHAVTVYARLGDAPVLVGLLAVVVAASARPGAFESSPGTTGSGAGTGTNG